MYARSRLVWLASVGAAALTLLAPPKTRAETSAAALERRVKAAFLYKFSGYVEWPARAFPRPESPIEIGIAGDKHLATDLANMVIGRTSAGRPISVVWVDEDDELENLHILFVARAETPQLSHWVEAVQTKPILLVTESDGALDGGSVINFVPSEGRVRFEVSLPHAQQHGLRLNSGLLAVAKAVTTGHP